MADLLTAPDLRGRVSLVADMRDDMGLIMLSNGHDPGTFTDAEFDLAVEVLYRAVTAGQIRTVTNNYLGGLDRGDIAACVGWAGDVLGQRRHNPDLHFVLPEAGGLLWTDDMMILAHASHAREAERLMDYFYEPEVAARLAASLSFICPVAGAEAWISQLEPALAQEGCVFPPPDVLAQAHYFKRLTPVQNSVCAEKFSSAVGL
jgi:spermidine/putrescine transport system substrate-binding protein